MKTWRGIVVLAILLVVGACATGPLPPSESTMSIVRSYRDQLDARVASGHLTSAQARDLYYAKLGDIQPPLPGLQELQDFRKQVTAQADSGALTPEQAESRLKSKESEMLARWEEMAAKYAQDQRNMERMHGEFERGYRQQQQMEQTIKNLPR